MSPTGVPFRSSLRQVSTISRTSFSSRASPRADSARRGRCSAIRCLRRRVRGGLRGSGGELIGQRLVACYSASNRTGLRASGLPLGEALGYPPRVGGPRDVLRTIRDELQQIFLERTELIDGALVAASNELPEDDVLLALNDRFLLRFVVDYLAEDFRFLKLLQARPPVSRTTLSLEALTTARAEAAALPVPGDVLRVVTDLRSELRRKSIVCSDRRYAQAVGVLRAHAYLEGRTAVADEDVPFLEHVLWRDPAERPQVRSTIRELLQGYEDEVRVLLYQSRELREYALRSCDTSERRPRAA